MYAARHILLFLLLAFTPKNMYCQATADALQAKTKPYILTPNISFFSTGALLPIDSIIKLDKAGGFARFRAQDLINITYTNQFYWLKFSIVNHEPPQQLLFILGSNLISVARLFVLTDTGVHLLGVAGNSIPPEQREDFSFYQYFQLPTGHSVNKKQDYYLFVDCRKHAMQLIPLLVNKKEFNYLERRMYLMYGIFSGLLLLAAFFNLFLFCFNRDKIHLLYFFYALSNWLFLLSIRNIDFNFFYPHFPIAGFLNRSIYSCFSLALSVMIMQVFLDQTIKNSRFFTLATIFKWLNIAMISLYILPEIDRLTFLLPYRQLMYEVQCLGTVLVILLSCIEKIMQRKKEALFYFAAILVLLIGSIRMLFVILGVTPAFEMPPALFEIGIVLESLIIFLGILYRYNQFRKENEQLTTAIQLEKMQAAEDVLKAQELEQKRIAQDLHDELGGNLAALKIALQNADLPSEKSEAVIKLIDNTSDNARTISHNLMPPEFDTTNLRTILTDYFMRLNRHGGIYFSFYYSGGEQFHFNKQDELMIYRMVMELGNNIIRHSHATEAVVQLLYDEAQLKIMAEDNGKGFNKETPTGLGLKNIQYRVTYLNGTLNIDSGPRGTTIIIELPYKNV